MPEAKSTAAAKPSGGQKYAFKDKEKPTEIRMTNIIAAKGKVIVFFSEIPNKLRCGFNICLFILAVADAVRTSLGPKGMDKMVNIHVKKLLEYFDR